MIYGELLGCETGLFNVLVTYQLLANPVELKSCQDFTQYRKDCDPIWLLSALDQIGTTPRLHLITIPNLRVPNRTLHCVTEYTVTEYTLEKYSINLVSTGFSTNMYHELTDFFPE